MQRVRASLLVVLLAAVITVSGFGCKGLSSTQQAATTPVTLEMWTVFDDVDALHTMIDQYKVLHPYINVVVRQFQPADLYPRLVEALADDHGPDIISVNSRDLGQFLSKLSPMPPSVNDTTILIEKTTLGTNTTVNTHQIKLPTTQQIDDTFVQAVGKDVVRGGKAYGLPLSFDTMALYYNKDLLDRSGVAEPPKTWDEFSAAVKKVTKYDKASGTIVQAGTALGTGNNVPNSDDIISVLFGQSSVPMTDKTGHALFGAVSGPGSAGETPAMAVLSFYTDFANPTRDTYTWNATMPNAIDAFISGQVGFFFGFSYHNSIIKSRAPQLNFRILPLLQLNPDNPVNAADYSVEAVPLKAKHPEAAWSFINYLTYSDVTKEYLKTTGRPTALRGLIAGQKDDPSLAPFVSQVLVATSWYRGSNYPAAARALNDMFTEWLLPPDRPDRILEHQQTVLQRAATKINQTL